MSLTTVKIRDSDGVEYDVVLDSVTNQLYPAYKLSVGAEGAGGRIVSDGNPLPVSQPFVDVAKGNLPDHSVIHKFGENPTVAINTFEDIWDGGGDWAPPTAARIHAVVSDSGNDDLGGSGAERVHVFGLDSNFELQDEEVILNGVVAVNTTKSYTMIHRMMVIQSNNGANDSTNAGNITATAAVDGTVTAQITTGNNQTLMAVFQVPSDKTGYMLDFYAHISGRANANSTVQLWAKPDGQPWQLRHVFSILAAGSSSHVHTRMAPDEFDGKTLLKMRADASAADTAISAGFDVLMVDD